MENLFEKKLTYNQISFRYSRGKSHLTGNEIHPYHEILYFIDGDATFLSEHFQEDLSGPTLLLIPQASYHQFCFRDQNSYTRLVLTFPDLEDADSLLAETMSEIKIIKKLNAHLTGLLERMCQVVLCEMPKKEHHVFLHGAFLMLLAELNLNDLEITSPNLREKDLLISRCIRYIDQNFKNPITARTLALEMNVSTSTLFHCFKKELGISLYKYIIEKRLIHAHKLIAENHPPTKVYLECGYNDYPTFYKAYVRMFGKPPSADKNLGEF